MSTDAEVIELRKDVDFLLRELLAVRRYLKFGEPLPSWGTPAILPPGKTFTITGAYRTSRPIPVDAVSAVVEAAIFEANRPPERVGSE